ncbi:uncharacterized protein LOC134541602 [Bacillus rossius redtenbacheri]|uniref:uncharacterized protein LOC134541602 n=1 Tax=Bacillus rossius redtenbacheri TaxID=93214 RepID=UPI002FDD2986
MTSPAAIYNCDESGFPLNNKPASKILAQKGSPTVVSQTCVERGENVTVVACTNAVGNYIPPFVIFKGKRYHKEYKDGFPNGTEVIMTESGWINEEAFVKWLHHFQKFRVAGRCLIVLDGHSSHKSIQALEFCEKNLISIICLPSHTTHRLQPLDRSFFKPLKTFYNETCNKFVQQHGGERKITKFNFGGIFRIAWSQAATSRIAESGFASTGIYPLNKDAVQNHEYLPSSACEQVSMPEEIAVKTQTETVPAHVPRSEDLVQGTSGAVLEPLNSPGTVCFPSPSRPKTSFHDLLLTPVKKVQKRKRTARKQTAKLLTSPDFIVETKSRKLGKNRNETVEHNKPGQNKQQWNNTCTKRKIGRRSDDDYHRSSCKSADEENDTACCFCNLKYSDPRSIAKGDWIQCQKGKEWYHELCVGAEGKKSFVCGRCFT